MNQVSNSPLTLTNSVKVFSAQLHTFTHHSSVLGCEMRFHLFVPAAPASGAKVPLLTWLSGLTCTPDNFAQKAGAFGAASRAHLALLMPDTSPRGVPVDGDAEHWDFGVGAGFYIDATVEKWKKNYNMYTYITKELPKHLAEHIKANGDAFPVDVARQSLFGHSMGGHGALSIALRKAGTYRSVSAFAPICHPSAPSCAWGQKAFRGYFGEDEKQKWLEHDSTELAKKYNGPPLPILIDQGGADNFLRQDQLQPEAFVRAALQNAARVQLTYRLHAGYDHSYNFIASFVEEHIAFHAQHLR